MYTNKEKKLANHLYDEVNIIPNKHTYEIFKKNHKPFVDLKILDFGSGKKSSISRELKGQGYIISSFDFGDNFNPLMHINNIFTSKFDINRFSIH